MPDASRDPRPETVAVIDIGASAVRLVIAELIPGRPPAVLDEAVRGVSLGKETFSGGRIGSGPMDAVLHAMEGFKRLMDEHGVTRYRAVATSAVREASNADTFLDRVKVKTGLRLDVIDASEESRRFDAKVIAQWHRVAASDDAWQRFLAPAATR